MKKKRNNFFLKEVGFSLLLKKPIDSVNTKKFVKELVKVLDMKIVFIEVVSLPPGFEILCCIKQSHIVLSYYTEYDFLRININSCKDFDFYKVKKFIEKYFKPKKIGLDVSKNRSLEKEIKYLCRWMS